jgi:opacity protein-like surface antigen
MAENHCSRLLRHELAAVRWRDHSLIDPGGWTVGGGAEYAVGYGWSVKGEYLYVKFDDYTTFTTGPFAAMNVSPREVKLDDHIWRAGMNYKFW